MVVYANSNDMIHIGRVGENNATIVAFDVTNWIEDFGEGNFSLLVEKDSDIYYNDCFLTLDKAYTYKVDRAMIANKYYRFYTNVPGKVGQIAFFSFEDKYESTIFFDATLNFYKPEEYFIAKATLQTKGEEFNTTFPVTYTFDDVLYQNNDKEFIREELINGQKIKVTYINLGKPRKISTTLSKNRYLLWQINKDNIRSAGLGKCAIQYNVNNILVKSQTYHTITTNALGEDQEIEPEEYNWVEVILDKANFIESNIKNSFSALERAESLEEEMNIIQNDVTEKKESVDESQRNIQILEENAKVYSEQAKAAKNTLEGSLETLLKEDKIFIIQGSEVGIRTWLDSEIKDLDFKEEG